MVRKNRLPPGPSRRDSQERCTAIRGHVRDGHGKSFRRIPPDASRYSRGAQTPIGRHVFEGIPALWRLAGSMDAVAGELRSEESGTEQKNNGACRANRACKGRRRSSGLSLAWRFRFPRSRKPANHMWPRSFVTPHEPSCFLPSIIHAAGRGPSNRYSQHTTRLLDAWSCQ